VRHGGSHDWYRNPKTGALQTGTEATARSTEFLAKHILKSSPIERFTSAVFPLFAFARRGSSARLAYLRIQSFSATGSLETAHEKSAGVPPCP